MLNTPDAIVLCGGAGLRLRTITGDVPKSMADVANRPFLELLLRQLRRHRFERVILAVGYRQDVIRSHFGERAFGLYLTYSAESSPLGTGGALRKAADLVESKSVLIMNGDSYTDADLREFVADYRESKSDASVIVVPADGRADCGTVLVDGRGRLAGFAEKQNTFHSPYVNAGIYLIASRIVQDIPPGLQTSLEKELFPQWLREGRHVRAFVCPQRCVDIGTPDRYMNAQDILATVEMNGDLPRGGDDL
jgi:NDP-sugar pyrophosphorylase family protein